MSAVGVERRKALDREKAGQKPEEKRGWFIRKQCVLSAGRDQSAGSLGLFCVQKRIGADHCCMQLWPRICDSAFLEIIGVSVLRGKKTPTE